jgi:hypothetical protein
MLQAGISWVLFPMRLLEFFDLPNHSSRTMALVTQPLTEISTRNLPSGQRAAGGVSLTTLQPYVRRLSTGPTGLHGLLQDSFAFPYLYAKPKVRNRFAVSEHILVSNKPESKIRDM